MIIKRFVPNTLTSLNLLSGSVALVFVFEGLLHIAAILVLLASVFDFLDGFSARILNAYSAIGKELDSLADLVSFGLVPSFIVYSYMQANVPAGWGNIYGLDLLPFTAFLIIIFSALRLAIFNIDDRQSEQFIGLPTPANALFFVSLPIILHYGSEQHFLYAFFQQLSQGFIFLLVLTLVSSTLLVSTLPLFSLKFKNFSFKENQIRYIFVIFSILAVIFLGIFALPLIIVFYILLSLTLLLKK